MKYITLLVSLIIWISCVQTSKKNFHFIEYAKRVDSFDTKTIVSSKKGGYPYETELKNSKGDILRFRVNNDTLLSYHCGLSFILYHFQDGWISTITTFGKNGKLKGDAEFNDIAIIQFNISKPENLKEKMAKIDTADGNIQMKDAQEQLVLQIIRNTKHEIIEEKYISSDKYWAAQNLLYRP